MRYNFFYVFGFRAFFDEKTVINFKPDAFNYIIFVFAKQVINLVDCTCSAVFKRKNAVLALSALNRSERIFPTFIIYDLRIAEKSVAGMLRISTFNTLTGNLCRFRKKLRRSFNGIFYSA